MALRRDGVLPSAHMSIHSHSRVQASSRGPWGSHYGGAQTVVCRVRLAADGPERRRTGKAHGRFGTRRNNIRHPWACRGHHADRQRQVRPTTTAARGSSYPVTPRRRRIHYHGFPSTQSGIWPVAQYPRGCMPAYEDGSTIELDTSFEVWT